MPSSVRDVYLAYLLRQWEGSSCIVFTSTCKVRILFVVGGGACCCRSSGRARRASSSPPRVRCERTERAYTWHAMPRPRGRT